VPDPQLLRAFRFRVTLMPSAPAAPPAGAGLSAGVSVGFSIGAGGVSASATASAGAGARFATGASLGDGGFAECSGLDVEMDVQELQEGGRNDGVIRRVGRARQQSIVLKRGMFHPRDGAVNEDLWRWLQDIVAGVRPVRRYDGIVEVMSVADAVAARWAFVRGLPAKVAGPQLNARTGEVAIEELHIAHEGLRLVAP
jgi:phage tail-like protein